MENEIHTLTVREEFICFQAKALVKLESDCKGNRTLKSNGTVEAADRHECLGRNRNLNSF